MRIVLLGPPGVGKGTLADHLKEKYHLAHISTGDMLREETKKDSPLGREIKGLMEKGALVSDELVTRLVVQKIEHGLDLKRGFMFDGFPRTVKQAQDLDAALERVHAPLDCVLTLEADFNVLLDRMTGRRVCRKCGALYHVTYKPTAREGICDVCGGEIYQRADDNEKTIKARMEVYNKSTAPIIDYYAQQNKLKKLNANVEAAEVRLAVAAVLK
ncbi:MAG: adenylate kinase [Candidatus Omnitrophica bacterium]|nr:adenylate kinase [Candidatus Omnitrophota bacterium]